MTNYVTAYDISSIPSLSLSSLYLELFIFYL